MKNILKKVMASVMAVTSLAIGMTGISASAADGHGNVYYVNSKYGDAYNSVTTTFVWVKTESTIGTVDEISAKITAWDGTLYGSKSLTYADSTSVSFSCSATGTTHASSSHSVKSYNGNTGTCNLYVTR